MSLVRTCVVAPVPTVKMATFVACGILAISPRCDAAELPFDDVSTEAGITKVSKSYGVSWGDFDGDGAPDFWAGNHFGNRPSLYRNNGDGTFTDIAGRVWSGNSTDDAHGAAWADFDNDGDQDLIQLVGANYGTGQGPNHFLVNENGALTDQAVQFGLDYPLGRGRTPLWFDADRDGRLDLMFVNMGRPDKVAPSMVFVQTARGFEPANDRLGLTERKPTWGKRLGNGARRLGRRLSQAVGWDGMSDRLGTKQLEKTGVFCKSDSAFATLLDPGDGTAPELLVCERQLRLFSTTLLPFTDVSGFLAPPRLSDVQDLASGDFDGDGSMDLFFLRSEHWLSQIHQSSPLRIQAFLVGGDRKSKEIDFVTKGPLTVRLVGDFAENQVRLGISGGRGTYSGTATLSGLRFELDAQDPAIRGFPDTPPVNENLVQIGYDAAEDRWRLRSTVKGLRFEFESVTSITDISESGFQSASGAMTDAMLVRHHNGYVLKVVPEMSAPTACVSVVAADFDNDMDLDLYLACSAPARTLPNLYYENLGDGRWRKLRHETSPVGSSGSVAVADYDQDGFLDLLVTNGRGEYEGPMQLYKNRGNANHWIEMDLQGTMSNRDGIGARVEIVAGGVTQRRLRSGGMHRYSQDFKRIHFGLGEHAYVDDIIVRWPSGKSQRLSNIRSDQVLRIVEPGNN